jgi:conjugal transfer/type IV secretion protein DotA/TraY
MRIPWPVLLSLSLLIIAGPAFAQATNPYDVSWSALDPGNDWAAQVLRSLFPIPGGTSGTSTGNEATVIGQIVGQLTGFVAAIAAAFVAYTMIINIHRAAETSRILGNGQSWMFVVRVGFAGIMMFPLGGGFSAGQALVLQGAMVGVGMAKALYANAVQAVGPDALVIAQPMVPGTEQIVSGLIDSELCMDLVNLASNTATTGSGPLVPVPQPITVKDSNGGYTTWRYSLSTGNQSGNPVCGTVTVRESPQNEQTVAGVSVDMAAVQKAVFSDVLGGSIRSQVASVAQNLWQNKQAAALVPLQSIFNGAVNTYTSELTTAATSIQSALNSALQANATQARNGSLDLLQNQVQQSTLGWTAAGAYYLEIAKLNATTLSLLNATPVTTAPSYDGLGPALSYDLAPLEAAQKDFMTTLKYVVQTTDGTSTPSGIPHTLADPKDDSTGAGILDRILGQLNISDWLLHKITDYLLPTTQIWTDPFGGLMQLGQTLINTCLIAMGAAAVLASGTTSTGLAIFQGLTFQWGAAAATIAGHAVMNFIGLPLLLGLMALMIPGLVIAYVLPMIPWIMWMAGVCGWIILVCEGMIAVPLWMLAHMTVGGDGLHGRAIEGWSLLFNIVFRPTLMVVGLFLGYFVFDCMSWLIRESFGIAAGFVLQNGWLVSNLIGITVLLTIFVMTHVVAALMSFRMVALLPHHLPRLVGFAAANRVDMEDFSQRAAWLPGDRSSRVITGGFQQGLANLTRSTRRLPRGPAGYISGPGRASGEADGAAAGMDTTLRATTETSPKGEIHG